MSLDKVQSPCGRHSIHINPRGQIIPCVYWPLNHSHTPSIEDLERIGEEVLETIAFETGRAIPPSAALCPCRGGCASCRALAGNMDVHDFYCPWVRGDTIELD